MKVQIILFAILSTMCQCEFSSYHLSNYLLEGYNKLLDPLKNNSDVLQVEINLKLKRIVEMNAKQQIMVIDSWLEQGWFDYRLQWNPHDYGNITKFYLPVTRLWVPEIVLYNTVNGVFELINSTKAKIEPNGWVSWETPAVFKSSCKIDMEYFPFDEQICSLKFSSWIYDSNQINFNYAKNNKKYKGIDISKYIPSVEWDLMNVTTKIENHRLDSYNETRPFLHFYLTLRRKTLFYMTNLFIPCLSLSFLTIVSFGLTSESNEKVTLTISLLMSLNLFFNIMVEAMPPSSSEIPILGKYLIFTIIMVSLCILSTIHVLYIYHHTPKLHKHMPALTKKIFLEIIPKYLLIRRMYPKDDTEFEKFVRDCRKHYEGAHIRCCPNYKTHFKFKAIEILNGISNFTIEKIRMKQIIEEWRYFAMVLDRLFFYIFSTVFFIGTIYIFSKNPHFFDDRKPLS